MPKDGPRGGPQECPAEHVCFWPEADYGGQMSGYRNPYAHTCGHVPGRSARSAVNNENQGRTLCASG
ncbi:hypothetical protein C1I98_00940 [Spongiactinospora gelatinilytica]|uniref:Uncharacterized protein n=1 Tax=Spongiactinospora gelatinilytica TaxID=2666298 RepID=A0A2W2J4S8_9ACTN|nr:peptidase inhibitor family I36 protein [Spongiactinospora gelatinilytica]PZG56644.1 hypothetical protein C1I98_00940 [Spongiactinospora gelatinilytica]